MVEDELASAAPRALTAVAPPRRDPETRHGLVLAVHHAAADGPERRCLEHEAQPRLSDTHVGDLGTPFHSILPGPDLYPIDVLLEAAEEELPFLCMQDPVALLPHGGNAEFLRRLAV